MNQELDRTYDAYLRDLVPTPEELEAWANLAERRYNAEHEMNTLPAFTGRGNDSGLAGS